MSLTTLQQLNDFVEMWNEGILPLKISKLSEYGIDYINDVSTSFTRQFTSSVKTRNAVGLSEVGKPAVILALKHLSFHKDFNFTVEDIDIKTQLRFHLGDVFESLILNILKGNLFDVSQEQDEVFFGGICGHIDAVLNDDTVLEVKTMSDTYFKRFVKEQDDSRGYLSQLNLYAHVLGKSGVWLCLNKQTNELASILLVPDKTVLDRATQVIKYVGMIDKFEDILEYFDAPEAVPEYFKKQPTGKYLLPESMRYCKFAPVFYQITQGLNGYKKPTLYVDGYNDVGKASEVFNDMIQEPF